MRGLLLTCRFPLEYDDSKQRELRAPSALLEEVGHEPEGVV